MFLHTDLMKSRSLDRYAIALVVVSFILCAPSYSIWFRPNASIGVLEFDWWLGIGPSVLIGRLVHSLLFIVTGLIYVLRMRQAAALPVWLVPAMVTVWTLGVPWLSPDVMYYLAEGAVAFQTDVNVYSTPLSDIAA
ncbi:MAG: hypothetical protein IBJ03_17625 [Gemmatimonadaceae bacterium]|nr:hypothetical protein [Gemmatimonadaceae bacterium]